MEAPEATRSLPVFDCGALFIALDSQRRDRGLGWYELADELWQQSSDLNAQRSDHPLCGGAVQRLQTRRATSFRSVADRRGTVLEQRPDSGVRKL
jgi:hypothetical protein